MMPPGGYVGGRPKDPSKLSTDPVQVRIRARRSAMKHARNPDDRMLDNIREDIEILYKKPITEWDLEELAHGRPRSRNGKFMGATPKWITPVVVREAKRRLMSEAFGNLAAHMEDAVQTIYNLMMSEEVDEKGKPIVDARTRLDAAKFIIENILGKPKAIIEVEGNDVTRAAIAAAIVLDDGLPQDMPRVIEGDFEEVEEDGEEE